MFELIYFTLRHTSCDVAIANIAVSVLDKYKMQPYSLMFSTSCVLGSFYEAFEAFGKHLFICNKVCKNVFVLKCLKEGIGQITYFKKYL